MQTWMTTSGMRVVRMLFGRTNVYLIYGTVEPILVDSGWQGDRRRLLRLLHLHGRPGQVVLTHTHFDHTANAWAVMQEFSPLFIVQEKEKAWLESGDSPLPMGTNKATRFLGKLGSRQVPGWFRVKGVPAGITFFSRYDFPDVPAGECYIMHTPGHSPGSSSVVVGNEVALVGDAMHGMGRSAYPPWGNDPAGIMASWKMLLETGCHTFLPGHGFPVSREKLERSLRRRSS